MPFDPIQRPLNAHQSIQSSWMNSLVKNSNVDSRYFSDITQEFYQQLQGQVVVNSFFGKIVNAGPNKEANYTDCRYWVQFQVPDFNTLTNVNDKFSVKKDERYTTATVNAQDGKILKPSNFKAVNIITATCLDEMDSNAHSFIDYPNPIRVFECQTISDNPVTSYTFIIGNFDGIMLVQTSLNGGVDGKLNPPTACTYKYDIAGMTKASNPVIDTAVPVLMQRWIYSYTIPAKIGLAIKITLLGDTPAKWKLIWVDEIPLTYPVIPVDLVSDGGADGTSSAAATYTYTLKDVQAPSHSYVTLATGISPENRRAKGSVLSALKGLAWYGSYLGDGARWHIQWMDEVPNTEVCP